MRFYFPDSQDLVSPSYDFVHDEYSPLRVRQRDDLYAHEVLDSCPYDGVLVSKAIVDGSVRGAGKYSEPQRQRLYRLGVRAFFRLPDEVASLGDCGSFNYAAEPEPPYSVREVLTFYEGCGFDAGISVDHVIFGYDPSASLKSAESDWRSRRLLSVRLAEDFLRLAEQTESPVLPVGAAQGWSPGSYAQSVQELQEMGYTRVALGGMVPLKTPDIQACLGEIDTIRKPEVELHLLGVTRIEAMASFAAHGVTSFDSTSPFRQAFMDDRRNYHTSHDAYVALRVPQVDGNPTLKRLILAGHVSQADAIAGERDALRKLRAFDAGESSLEETLDALLRYSELVQARRSYEDDYRRFLTAAPWRSCACSLCRTHGIEIAIFRGTERNKRRGFHNLAVLAGQIADLNRSQPTSRTRA